MCAPGPSLALSGAPVVLAQVMGMFSSCPGVVPQPGPSTHLPCHLEAPGSLDQAADLFESIPEKAGHSRRTV